MNPYTVHMTTWTHLRYIILREKKLYLKKQVLFECSRKVQLLGLHTDPHFQRLSEEDLKMKLEHAGMCCALVLVVGV